MGIYAIDTSRVGKISADMASCLKAILSVKSEIKTVSSAVKKDTSIKSTDKYFANVIQSMDKEYWKINTFKDVLENVVSECTRTEGVLSGDDYLAVFLNMLEDAYKLRDNIYKGSKNFYKMLCDLAEEYTFKDPSDTSNGINEFFERLDMISMLIEIIKNEKKILDGHSYEAYKESALKLFKAALEKGNKWLDKKYNLKYLGVDKQVQSTLLSVIANIPIEFIDNIREYAESTDSDLTAGRVYVNTMMDSIVKSVAGNSYVKSAYIGGTAAAYPIVNCICRKLGYDLSGQYENLTGKKGLSAVFAAEKELFVDIVYDGAKKKMAEGVDSFYEAVGQGWKYWKSGVKVILEH